MQEHQKVTSSLEISKTIAYYLGRDSPTEERIRTIQAVNDVLQGRSDQTPEDLMREVREKLGSYYAPEAELIGKEVQKLQARQARQAQRGGNIAHNTAKPAHRKARAAPVR